MVFVIADRVRESTTTTGTTDFALGGAITDFNAFSSVMSNGDTTWYACIFSGGGGWEVGLGTLAPGTLQRTTILASSTGGAKVSFGAGTKDLFMDLPAAGLPIPATTAQFLANIAGLSLVTDKVWAAGTPVVLTSVADATVTITNASPGVVTDTAHGFTGNEPVHFTTTGALPTGLTANTEYYVLAAGLTTNTYQVSATRGGSAINTSSAGSGTHTRVRRVLVDGSLGVNFSLTLARNITLAKPYNMKAGQSGRITFTQDGTGTRTLTYPNAAAGGWGIAGTTAIALSTAASTKDKLYYDAESSTDVVISAAKAIA